MTTEQLKRNMTDLDIDESCEFVFDMIKEHEKRFHKGENPPFDIDDLIPVFNKK